MSQPPTCSEPSLSFHRELKMRFCGTLRALPRAFGAALRVGVLLITLPSFGGGAEAQSTPALTGFTSETTATQRALESRFDSLLQADNLREWMKRMTARPHHVGSPFGKEVASFIAEQFRSWGYTTEIERFDVLFPTPKTRLLEMISPKKFTARLEEPPVSGDSTSQLTAEQLPGYNAFCVDGEAVGSLVYVNFGLPRDYELLAERGISVEGKIVIARYGNSWRGIKPKLAAEKGAVGCLIYSDPREEGFFEGDVYPDGPWRNEHGVERGSVLDLPVQPGDPLTPQGGSTPNATRLKLEEARTLCRIPVLPISYADALPLLRALGGPVAPEPWRGALPITYRLGPGPATVRLKLEFHWQQAPAYNVVARLEGAERPEQWVIRGNHHDAWVFGAEDPVSGMVALMEEARVIGALARTGWKPKRTIIFTAWDAEEPGLLGSTEWVETHAEQLRQHAVAYINGDNNQRGFLRAGGSHTLETFVSEIARDVIDPQKKVPVLDRARARAIAARPPGGRTQIRNRSNLPLNALGSGSDFTPFLQHLGIASLDLRYGGEADGGSYHSAYDSYDYYVRFADPHFAYGVTLAKTSGRAVLRLASANILPLDLNGFAETLAGYVTELEKLADQLRADTIESNRLLSERTLELTSDSQLTFVAPAAKDEVPPFEFAPLNTAVRHLRERCEAFHSRLDEVQRADSGLSPEIEKKLDAVFMHLERTLTRAEGLPRRPWYKHLIYAPGYYTGYSVKTIPGVREALEERQWGDVKVQIDIAAQALGRFTDQVDRATRLLP